MKKLFLVLCVGHNCIVYYGDVHINSFERQIFDGDVTREYCPWNHTTRYEPVNDNVPEAEYPQ